MSENGRSFELFGLMVKAPPSEELHESTCHYQIAESIILETETGDNNTQYLNQISVQESFDDMVIDHPSEKRKTLVVLDCANIGWAYGGSIFCADGINIAINFFSNYKVDVIAFIPSSYLKKKPR